MDKVEDVSRRSWAFMATLAAGLTFSSAFGRAAEPSAMPGDLSAVDYAFVGQTFLGDQFEIDSGKVALQHGSSAAVKAFAGEMVPTHETVKADLVEMLKTKSAVQPPMSLLEGTYAVIVGDLKKVDGAALDREYARRQVEYQTANTALFKWEIENGKDADVVAYARKVLPEIENHLGRARALVEE